MSNYLAIATITAAMQQVLHETVSSKLPGAQVTTLRPDELGKGAQHAGVNVYLFQATPNPSLRNFDLPTRSANGQPVGRGTIALDLQYLITFFGKEDRQEPEVLLACSAIALAANAILTQTQLAQTIANAPSAGLAGSDLPFQTERVRISPYIISLEDLHRLWTVFSPIPYRLSSVYTVSVVLLDVDPSEDVAPPVLTPQLGVSPSMPATIVSVFPSRMAFAPGAVLQVQVSVTTTGAVCMDGVPLATQQSGTQLTATLPSSYPAGVRSLTIAGPPTSSATLIVQPKLGPAIRFSKKRGAAIIVQPTPEVWPNQSAELLLTPVKSGTGLSSSTPIRFFMASDLPPEGPVSEATRGAFESNGYPLHRGATVETVQGELRLVDGHGVQFALRAESGGTMVYGGLTQADPAGSWAFAFESIAAGEYLVRMRVDGVESSLSTTNGVFAGPRVKVK